MDNIILENEFIYFYLINRIPYCFSNARFIITLIKIRQSINNNFSSHVAFLSMWGEQATREITVLIPLSVQMCICGDGNVYRFYFYAFIKSYMQVSAAIFYTVIPICPDFTVVNQSIVHIRLTFRPSSIYLLAFKGCFLEGLIFQDFGIVVPVHIMM